MEVRHRHLSCANVDTSCIRLEHGPVFQTHSPVSSPPHGLCFLRCSVDDSLVAGFLSCKLRPSCASKDTLPNGISWTAPTVNHCSAYGTWNHASARRSENTPLRKRLLPLPTALFQVCRYNSPNTSSSPLCLDHRPGPVLVGHRQTKKAETDMQNLMPPRHISTLQVWCSDP
jgi:hypothetical protein